MTAATIGNWSFKLDDDAGTPVLTLIEEVTDLSGLGMTNELVDVTNWDSGNSREFLGGLKDGKEFTLGCNFVPAAAGQIIAMVAAEAGASRGFEVAQTVSPNKKWTGTVVCLGYELVPSQEEGNSLSFTFKISGTLVRA